MEASLSDRIVSQYGFMVVEVRSGSAYLVNLYIPVSLLDQLQLTAGSSVLVQGLSPKPARDWEPTEFYLRSRTGLENRNYPNPFTATIRFPNKPQMLRSFINRAREADIPLLAIRTFGERGDEWAEVMVEGSMPARWSTASESGSFIERAPLRDTLEALLEGPEGKITAAQNLKFASELHGYVLPSLYSVDLPVFAGNYLKVQVDTHGTPAGKPFHEARGQVRLVRLRLDLSSMTLRVDYSFSRRAHFLLLFKGRNLQQAPPVTKAILDSIPGHFNVDSISAYEYVEFDPTNPHSSPAAGRIEMLCTVSLDEEAPDDAAASVALVKAAVVDVLPPPAEVEEISLRQVASLLTELEQRHLGELAGRVDIEHGVFRKLLKNGRYAYMQPLGEGAQGSVHRYYDLHKCRSVAGKRILSEQIPSKELRSLLFKRGQGSNPHLAPLLDYFFDDNIPILVMPWVKHTLSDHAAHPQRNPAADPHRYPEDVAQFAEMGIQLCDGLDFLHQPDAQGERLVHCDIKPQNIGLDIERGSMTWRLLDFGLARRQPAAKQFEYTTTLRGTYDYMSPQVVIGLRTILNDIYALGIVLFQAANQWRHPGDEIPDTKFASAMGWNARLPDQVDRYVRYLKHKAGDEPEGFARERWAPEAHFMSGVSHEGSIALGGIVLKMVELSESRRWQTAAEVRAALEEWRGEYLAPGG